MNPFVEAQKAKKRGPSCWYVKVTPLLDTDMRKALDVSLEDGTIDSTTIAEVLSTVDGVRVTGGNVIRHRKRGTATGCACDC